MWIYTDKPSDLKEKGEYAYVLPGTDDGDSYQ